MVAEHVTEEGLLGRHAEFVQHEQSQQTQVLQGQHHVLHLVGSGSGSGSPHRPGPTPTSVSPETVAIDCSSQRLSSASSGYGSQRGSDYGLPHGEDNHPGVDCVQMDDDHRPCSPAAAREPSSAVDMSYLSRI
jgi:hypothetical protein